MGGTKAIADTRVTNEMNFRERATLALQYLEEIEAYNRGAIKVSSFISSKPVDNGLTNKNISPTEKGRLKLVLMTISCAPRKVSLI